MKSKQFLIYMFVLLNCAPTSAQPSNMTLTGQYGPAIQLSAGTPAAAGGRSVSVSGATTQASATGSGPDSENFSASIDFGDLSKGDGNAVTGVVGLRVRSNSAFKLTVSNVQFQATGLRYLDKPIDSSDGGSFIRVWTGAVSTTGAKSASAADMAQNSALLNGMQLSAVSRGPATASSTAILSGSAASLGGTPQSPDNAIEIPLFVSVPSGYDLGPAGNAAQGSFSFSMQFGIFGGP